MSDATWAGRRCAITGATGFLGTHLTQELIGRGADVVALVRDGDQSNPLSAVWLESVEVVRGDVRDSAAVERLLAGGVDVVFHLAAQSQVGTANAEPVPTFDTNIAGTWAVLDGVRRSTGVHAVIIASSDKAYGAQSTLPYTEDMPLLARHPYDVSKACADSLAASYHASFGLPVCVTRCGNLFGPGDTNWDRLVPGTIRSFLNNERPPIRSDGTMTRDYLHVVDAVRGYLGLAGALLGGEPVAGMAFNLSLEEPVSVLEMVKLIRDAVGSDLEPDVLGLARNEIQNQYLSAARARDALGWRPTMSLSEGLDDTVRWYRGYLGAH